MAAVSISPFTESDIVTNSTPATASRAEGQRGYGVIYRELEKVTARAMGGQVGTQAVKRGGDTEIVLKTQGTRWSPSVKEVRMRVGWSGSSRD